jgi:cytochrome c biogenesis protein
VSRTQRSPSPPHPAPPVEPDLAEAGDQSLSTQPSEPRPPALSPWELLRWAWRQLTSMRVALILLFLLALAAIPGSLVPQRNTDPLRVSDYFQAHPKLAPLLDKVQAFDVFSSVWFSAVYLLLFISLIGCIVPRTVLHLRVLRSRPPAAPRNLSRMPAYRRFETDAPPERVLALARQELRTWRARKTGPGEALSVERGYLRETGNLLFHIALLGVIVAVAIGHLLGYKATTKIMVPGDGYANNAIQMDDFRPGTFVSGDTLPPFSFTLDHFDAAYQTSGPTTGAAKTFVAHVRAADRPGGPVTEHQVQVNSPLTVDGVSVYLQNHGYAPVFTVRDGKGAVAFSGPVPFLPQDPVNLASTGVVKVNSAQPQQIGLQGFFLPTATIDPTRGPISEFPGPLNPEVFLTAWVGDLGMSNGTAQSVYTLDTQAMKQLKGADGQPLRLELKPGQSATLPNGAGTVSFDGYRQWVNFQIHHDPGQRLALGCAAAAVLGLMLSLGIRRRRIWVRASAGSDGRTVVEVAGLSRTENERLPAEVERVVAAIEAAAGAGVAPSGEHVGDPTSVDRGTRKD